MSTIISTVTVSATASATAATSTDRAAHQGILQHGNPIVWNASDPIALFVVQVSIIVVLCRLLHWPLKMIRQPRVISEVLGGIVLGPTVLGRIPGFTATIFPTANGALAPLNLVANLGLVFFLFLVGVEADLRLLGHNWKTAATVGTLGMVFPFGCGAAIAWGLYNQFHTDPGLLPIPFGTYMLFIAIAMSITAFPVLCRILTELKLLHTPVGIVAISAGIANDVVGWILLALCVALVNASDGITALYVLLVSIGYILALCFLVRPAFIWLLKRTGAIDNGPSQGIVALTMMMVLISAWFTNIIGIHAVFGAFLMGMIMPHEGGFAIKITEKIEDFVSGVFVPIYFALSGLNTNIGLLSDGITWAYVIGIIVIAFITKISGGTLAARLTGRRWRESLAIGVLMSCKGLVELIVLNIGYNARILSQRTFTMFVVMAIVTTFATTPLVRWLYPPWYQQKLESWRRGDTDWDGKPSAEDKGEASSQIAPKTEVNRMAVHLRLDTLPGVLALVALFARRNGTDVETQVHPSKQKEDISDPAITKQPFEVHGIRLKEIGDRESSVMKVSNIDDDPLTDPVVNTFRITLSQIVQVAVRGIVLRCLPESFASTIVDCCDDTQADLMLLSWSLSGNLSEGQLTLPDSSKSRFENGLFSHFMSETSAIHGKSYKTATFIDNGFGGRRTQQKSLARKSTLSLRETATNSVTSVPLQSQGHHVYLPFFGTEDDVAALHLVLQLARDPAVTATIVFYEIADAITMISGENESPTASKVPGTSTADVSAQSISVFHSIRDTLPESLSQRVVFETVSVTTSKISASAIIDKAKLEVGQNPKNAGDLVVLGRNSQKNELSVNNTEWTSSEAGKSLGSLAGALINCPEKLVTSYLVIYAGENQLSHV